MRKIRSLLSNIAHIVGLLFLMTMLIFAIVLLRDPEKSSPASLLNSYPPPSNPTQTPTNTTVPYPPPGNPRNFANNYDGPPKDPNNLRITPTIPAIAEDGWYIFTDNEVGYSFRYPKNSHLTSGKGPRYKFIRIELEYHVPNEISYHGISISVEPNPMNISPAQFAANIYSEIIPNENMPSELTNKASTLKVGNTTATKMEIPPTLSEFTLLIPYKDKMVIISPVRDPMIENDPVKILAMEIFTNILKTFVFNP